MKRNVSEPSEDTTLSLSYTYTQHNPDVTTSNQIHKKSGKVVALSYC